MREIAIWCGVLIAVLVVGAVALALIRGRILGGSQAGPGEALTLHDLRRLRDQGRLSDEEFESARAAVLGKPAGVVRAKEGFDLTGEPLPVRGAEKPREPEGP